MTDGWILRSQKVTQAIDVAAKRVGDVFGEKALANYYENPEDEVDKQDWDECSGDKEESVWGMHFTFWSWGIPYLHLIPWKFVSHYITWNGKTPVILTSVHIEEGVTSWLVTFPLFRSLPLPLFPVANWVKCCFRSTGVTLQLKSNIQHFISLCLSHSLPPSLSFSHFLLLVTRGTPYFRLTRKQPADGHPGGCVIQCQCWVCVFLPFPFCLPLPLVVCLHFGHTAIDRRPAFYPETKNTCWCRVKEEPF